MAEQLLIVEDDRHIAELIALYARNAGYETAHAVDGLQGVSMAASLRPALVILDLMLPGLDGWEACKRIRARDDVPIVMLTARDDDVDKIVGLELGADDYLTKPFNPRELMARIKAILRRGRSAATGEPGGGEAIQIGHLIIDGARREARIGQRALTLRAKEFDLMLHFCMHPGLVFTREKLLELVWGFDFAGETRTVDVHVAQLRKQIGGSVEALIELETVFGVGYKLKNANSGLNS